MGQVEKDALLCVGENQSWFCYLCMQCYTVLLQWVLLRCMFHHSHDYYDMRFEIILRVLLTIVNKLTKSKKIPDVELVSTRSKVVTRKKLCRGHSSYSNLH